MAQLNPAAKVVEHTSLASSRFDAQGFLRGPDLRFGALAFYGSLQTAHNKQLPVCKMDVLRVNHANGTHVVEVPANHDYNVAFMGTDGFWSSASNIALRVYTADCIPVSIVTPFGIGMAHVGRRNLQVAIGVLETLNVPKTKTFIQFGPHICPGCYRLEKGDMHGLNPDCAQYAGLGYYEYDISHALYLMLLEWGIPAENICRFGDNYCTSCYRDSAGMPVFDSYRRWQLENQYDPQAVRNEPPMFSYLMR